MATRRKNCISGKASGNHNADVSSNVNVRSTRVAVPTTVNRHPSSASRTSQDSGGDSPTIRDTWRAGRSNATISSMCSVPSVLVIRRLEPSRGSASVSYRASRIPGTIPKPTNVPKFLASLVKSKTATGSAEYDRCEVRLSFTAIRSPPNAPGCRPSYRGSRRIPAQERRVNCQAWRSRDRFTRR